MKNIFTVTALLFLSSLSFSQAPVMTDEGRGVGQNHPQGEAKLLASESIFMTPNPVYRPSLETRIVSSNVEIFSYHVFTSFGQIVEIENLAGRPDPNFIKMPDGTLPGLYYVKFETDSGWVTRKLMVL